MDILETLVVRSMFPKSLEKAEVAVGFNYAPLSQLVKSSTWIEANKLSVYSPPRPFLIGSSVPQTHLEGFELLFLLQYWGVYLGGL